MVGKEEGQKVSKVPFVSNFAKVHKLKLDYRGGNLFYENDDVVLYVESILNLSIDIQDF